MLRPRLLQLTLNHTNDDDIHEYALHSSGDPRG